MFRKRRDVEGLAETSLKNFGSVDILCNNAGVSVWPRVGALYSGVGMGNRRKHLGSD